MSTDTNLFRLTISHPDGVTEHMVICPDRLEVLTFLHAYDHEGSSLSLQVKRQASPRGKWHDVRSDAIYSLLDGTVPVSVFTR